MQRTNKGILLTLAFLLVTAPLSATTLQTKRDELRQAFEKREAAYWKEKNEMLHEMKQTQTTLDGLTARIPTLLERKKTLEDEIRHTGKRADDLAKTCDERASSERAFRTAFEESVAKEEEVLAERFPAVIAEAVPRLNEVRAHIADGAIDDALLAYFRYREYLIAEGARIRLETGGFINTKSGIREGAQKVIMGYMAYHVVTERGVYTLIPGRKQGERVYRFSEDIPDALKGDIRRAVQSAFASAGVPEGTVPLPCDIAQAGVNAKEMVVAPKTSLGERVLSFIRKGGPVMYPLFLVALLALIIIVERAVFFYRNRKNVDHFLEEGIRLFLAGRKDEALTRCRALHSPVIRVVIPVIEREAVSKESAERIVDEMLLREVPLLERRLSTLAITAGIAPLLGLLGTVTGMIALFATMTSGGGSDPSKFAGGISEALITTQTGLGIAIPVMFIHHVLTRVKNSIVSRIEVTAARVLSLVAKNEEASGMKQECEDEGGVKVAKETPHA